MKKHNDTIGGLLYEKNHFNNNHTYNKHLS